MTDLTFVVAANDRHILNRNLLSSPLLKGGRHQLIIKEGFESAARAYNEAIEKSVNDIVVFVHQDVFLPENWISDIGRVLRSLQLTDPQWGVLGCWGVADDRRKFGYIHTPGDGILGRPIDTPARVRVLDEVLLVIRKSSRLRFSEQIPGFHFYGADLCLTAANIGMNCYAMSAFCIHNSRQYFEYPPDFYASYRAVKKKWRAFLPIQTSCICVSRFDFDIWKRRIKQFLASVTGRSMERGSRIEDPTMILEQVRAQVNS